jgi:hypothetical protein
VFTTGERVKSVSLRRPSALSGHCLRLTPATTTSKVSVCADDTAHYRQLSHSPSIIPTALSSAPGALSYRTSTPRPKPRLPLLSAVPRKKEEKGGVRKTAGGTLEEDQEAKAPEETRKIKKNKRLGLNQKEETIRGGPFSRPPGCRRRRRDLPLPLPTLAPPLLHTPIPPIPPIPSFSRSRSRSLSRTLHLQLHRPRSCDRRSARTSRSFTTTTRSRRIRRCSRSSARRRATTASRSLRLSTRGIANSPFLDALLSLRHAAGRTRPLLRMLS